MRLFISMIAITAMAFAASTASAVEFSLEHGASVDLNVGEVFDIHINVDNADGTGVQGLGASIFGYNEAVADFDAGTGRAARSFFTQFCGGANNCFGGIDQADNAFFNRLNLVESAIGANGNRVQIVNAAALSPTVANGANDQGWDGTAGTPDVPVTFRAIGVGTTVLQIGTGYQGDGVVLAGGAVEPAGQSTTFTINVIPEPGTALLMGLGLAGLAMAGRRE